MNSPGYALNLTAAGLRAEVLFNEWHAYRLRDDRRRNAQMKLNQWMLEGVNTVRVVLERSPTLPELGTDVTNAPALEIAIVTGEQDGPADQELISLFRYQWSKSHAPLPQEGPAEVVSHRFTMPRAFGRWGWESARLYANDDRTAVFAAISELHRALVNKDAEAFVAGMSMKLEEQARATGRDGAKVLETQEKFLGGMMGMGTWVVEPIRWDELEVLSTAGGKVVEVAYTDGTPPLAAGYAEEGPGMAFSTSLANIGGTYRVVR